MCMSVPLKYLVSKSAGLRLPSILLYLTSLLSLLSYPKQVSVQVANSSFTSATQDP